MVWNKHMAAIFGNKQYRDTFSQGYRWGIAYSLRNSGLITNRNDPSLSLL